MTDHDDTPRFTPFTEAKRAVFLTEVARTGSIRGACGRTGIARATVYYAANAEPDFREAIDRAINEAEQSLLDRIIQNAATGKVIERRGTRIEEPGDWHAAAWLLEHSPFFRDQYAGIMRQKVELSGNPDLPPVEVSETKTVQIELGPEMIDRLQAVVGVLLRAGKLRLPDPSETDVEPD